MSQLLAFTNCQESKSEAIIACHRHIELDLLIKGRYQPNEKGQSCMIGCHYGGDHSLAPAKHGFDEKFARLCDRIFEMHDSAAAGRFPLWVMENVGEGADTNKIWWEFFALTVEGFGSEWAGFAAECRADAPSISKLQKLTRDLARDLALALDLDLALALALDLDRALDLDLARALDLALENFKKAVLKFNNQTTT